MNHQKLIPVFINTIAGISTQLVDARELHTFLEVGKFFANWIKDRIKQYDFQENEDYFCVAKSGNGGNKGFQPIEYHLTLDMAKELSMVERNKKGKQARRYFIECEKYLLSELSAFLKPITEPITIEDFNWRHKVITTAFQNLKNAKVVITFEGSELLIGTRLVKSKRLF
jgi:phage anti-repressor protein